MSETIRIERTNSGLPSAWECGGGKTNTGEAVVWAGKLCSIKSPIFVRTRGPLANENHALFRIETHMHRVRVKRNRDELDIDIDRVTFIGRDYARVERQNTIRASRRRADRNRLRSPMDTDPTVSASVRQRDDRWRCRRGRLRR